MAKKKQAPKKKSPAKKAVRKPAPKKPAHKKPAVTKRVAKKAVPARPKAKPAPKKPAKKPVAKAPAKKAAPPMKAAPVKKVPLPVPTTKKSASGTGPKAAPTVVKAPPPAPKTAPVAKKEPASPAPPPAPKAAKTKEPKVKEPIIAVMTGVDPLSGPVRTLKRALKERFQVEIYVRSTPFALYELISTPSGFSKWFCDDVNVRGEDFTFIWGNDQQAAEVLSRKQGELMRFHWKDDDDEGSFFELRIRIDPLTNEVALVITDHAWPNELAEARQLWESQVHTLQRVLGA